MEQDKYTYVVCTSEGLAALQRLHGRKANQRKKERNHHGKFKLQVVVRALDVIRESGEVGISNEDLRARLCTEFNNLTASEVTSVMHVISREVRPIVEAHRCPDETPKAS